MATIKNPTTVISGDGTDVVNGIIENYKASAETIAAGTFVEFIENWGAVDTTEGVSLSSQDSYASEPGISAVQIDENKVFVVFVSGADSTQTNNFSYAAVCIVDGVDITVGTAVQLNDTSGTTSPSMVVKVDTNIAFIVDNRVGYRIYGTPCIIDGTTITVKTRTMLDELTGATVNYHRRNITACSITLYQVFFAWQSKTSSSTKRFRVGSCTIRGTNLAVTVGTRVEQDSSVGSASNLSSVPLDNARVFLAFPGASSEQFAMICTVNIATRAVTLGTAYELNSSNSASNFSDTALLEKDKIFMTQRVDSRLYGMICVVSGTTITSGSTVQLSSESYSYAGSAVAVVDGGVIFIVSTSLSNQKLRFVVVGANGSGVEVLCDGEFYSDLSSFGSGAGVSAPVHLDNGRVFVANLKPKTSAAANATAFMANAETLVRSATAGIDGLTKTECTTSTAGDVWVLNS